MRTPAAGSYRYFWGIFWACVSLTIAALLAVPRVVPWIFIAAFLMAWVVALWRCPTCRRPVAIKRHLGFYYSYTPGVRHCRHCSTRLV